LPKIASPHRKCEHDENEWLRLRVTVQRGVDMICEARHQIGIDIDSSAASRTVFLSGECPRAAKPSGRTARPPTEMNISRRFGALLLALATA
jgi:hypothetical protein